MRSTSLLRAHTTYVHKYIYIHICILGWRVAAAMVVEVVAEGGGCAEDMRDNIYGLHHHDDHDHDHDHHHHQYVTAAVVSTQYND
jgi:hypothetical protein